MVLSVANPVKSGEPRFVAPPHLKPSVPAGYPLHSLDQDQLQTLSLFRGTHLPQIKASLTGAPLGNEDEWANDEILVMFLKATKWDLAASVTRLTTTMQWRRDFRPTELDTTSMDPNCAIGSQILHGFDRMGRPIMCSYPRLGSKHKDGDASVKYSLYLIEKAIKMMPKGVTQILVLTDFTGSTLFNGFPPSVSIKFMNLLATHYPERLGKMINYKPSWYLSFLFSVLGPFMDPDTKRKLVFISGKDAAGKKEYSASPETGGWFSSLQEFVDPDQLMEDFGGDSNYDFVPQAYWDELVKV
ncbi:hypothetical protein CcCBS67573_g00879 [Chytriomyces confervae]|uniref:CRAL-TRIO domain-containing protein n=1 Tax=Chytriomyces confervae TaxID=246404 RepID=A0A507FNJ9_9FUNG|nr:hypothetical protein HDU80_000003 [Chytriomyces hyalinus]TPX77833.1 hypothetical protein CcCBS67573_g00879 [Chytriomyces confervae]